MQKKAKKWYDKYDAELLSVSHDTLTFSCRKLTEKEAVELYEDIKNLFALVLDCDLDETLYHLMNKEKFTIWWD